MRAGHAIPMFAAAFLLGANVVGTIDTVRFRVREAVSTTTTTSGTAEPSTTAEKSTSVSLAAVEAKAPKDGVLRFERARIALGHDRLTADFVKPVGWKAAADGFPTKLKPTGRKMGDEGWMTDLDVGTSCDGACGPKDWATIIEKNAKDAVPTNAQTREERMPDGRLVRWTTTADSGYVYAAWFSPGESRYYSCSAWLKEKALIPYVDAFVEICKTAKVEKQ